MKTNLLSWVEKVNAFLKSIKFIDSSDIIFYITPSGITAKLKATSKARNIVGSGGSDLKWARVTTVTSLHAYVCSIWNDRDDVDPSETLQATYVYDITTPLGVNDWILVQASTRAGYTYENAQPICESGGGGGGTIINWAEVTGVTDANNYTVSVWTNRSSYANGDIASETSKQCRVPKIIDALSVGDDFGVEASTLTGEDYIAIQQLGLL